VTRRHPILDAVAVALVLVGIALVIGVTTGDDSEDAVVSDELAAEWAAADDVISAKWCTPHWTRRSCALSRRSAAKRGETPTSS
jgi:hypothetical protein